MLQLGRCPEGCRVLTQRYKAQRLKGGMMAAGHPEVGYIPSIFERAINHPISPLMQEVTIPERGITERVAEPT
jgi:hypothetical protein